MKKKFEGPSFKVVHFNNSVITASKCGCFGGGYDWGYVAPPSCSDNLPECSCGEDTVINCV